MTAVDELIAYRKQFGRVSPTLRRVHALHKASPHLLDFLVQELRDVRDSEWTCASVHSLWEHARWVLAKGKAPGEDFAMPNAFAPYYARIICILHPEFNGYFVMAKSQADKDLGTAMESSTKDQKPGYIRRLRWADGTAIEHGWRPSKPHEPKPVLRRPRVKRDAN